MRILAFLTEAEARGRHPPPPGAARHATTAPLPARGPPQHVLGFDAGPGSHIDQTPAFDPTDPEPAQDFDFDQSRGA